MSVLVLELQFGEEKLKSRQRGATFLLSLLFPVPTSCCCCLWRTEGVGIVGLSLVGMLEAVALQLVDWTRFWWLLPSLYLLFLASKEVM